MIGKPLRYLVLLVIALLTVLPFTYLAIGCPFCSMQGQTLIGDVNQASMVLYGSFTNAKLEAGGDGSQGTTDLQIDAVIKKHEILRDKKVLTLPRYIPPTDKKTKFLVF